MKRAMVGLFVLFTKLLKLCWKDTETRCIALHTKICELMVEVFDQVLQYCCKQRCTKGSARSDHVMSSLGTQINRNP